MEFGRFLPLHQHLFASADIDQDRRTAQIDVGPRIFGAVALVAVTRRASPIEHVGRGLPAPLDLAGFHVHGDYGIGGLDIGPRVAISGGHVNQLSLQVERR